MKYLFVSLFTFLSLLSIDAQTPNTHIEFESTDKGILIPRMDSSVRNAIAPNLNEESLLVYDNNLKQFMYWDGSEWSQIGNKDQYVYPTELNILMGTNVAPNRAVDFSTGTGRFNTVIGNNAASELISGRNNVIVGNAAAFSLEHGSNNVIIGNGAAANADTTNSLVAIGVSSGSNNEGGSNTFVGAFSGQNNTDGASNSFFGIEAGRSNTTGNGNSFYGSSTGRNNVTGFLNSFFGQNSGVSNTTGNSNSFYGAFAGRNNTTGGWNTFVGGQAGSNNTIGTSNSLFGNNAGANLVDKSRNTMIGTNAGFSSNGFFNTFVGADAGGGFVGGFRNVTLGMDSGRSIEGNRNIVIGTGAGFRFDSLYQVSNSIFIGDNVAQINPESSQLIIESGDQNFPLIQGNFATNILDLNAFVTINQLLRVRPSTSPVVCNAALEGAVYYQSQKLQVCTVDNTGPSPMFVWQALH